MSLLTTMVWLGLIMAVGFGLAGLSVQHLTATNTQDHRQQALQMARSAASLAISRLVQDSALGKHVNERPPVAADLLEVKQGDAVGWVTFHQQVAQDKGLSYSTNNLENPSAVVGSAERSVPANAAVVVAEGRSGGLVRRVETVVAVPPFPFALASAGPIVARRGVTIAGVRKDLTSPLDGDDQLVPANILSNDATGEALFLGPGTNITGDAQAVGTVQLDPNAAPGTIKVNGKVTSGAAAQKIPHIALTSYDPQAGAAPFTTLSTAEYGDSAPLTGAFRRQGDLTITNGLQLDGGVLYVHGNLTIRSGIRGKGMVVATGNVHVDGQTEFQAGNGVALLAGHDLTLTGGGPAGSYFQGLVYTEGSFTADKVTMVGSMIAAGEENRSPVILEEARVIQRTPALRVTPSPTGTPVPGGSPVDLQTFTDTVNGEPVTANATKPGPHWIAHIYVSGTSTSYDVNLGSNRDEATAALFEWSRKNMGASYEERDFFTNLMTVFDQELAPYEPPGEAPGGLSPATVTTFDPSQFLHLAERMRVVVWKEN